MLDFPLLVAGQQGVFHGDWHNQAEALSTALHPDVDQLVILLNKLYTSTPESSLDDFSGLKSCVDAVTRLPATDFSSDDKATLNSILQEKLKWNSDAQQFVKEWDGKASNLHCQLQEISRAIRQWQQSIVDAWEATGYRHDAEDPSHLINQCPVRVSVNNVFKADATDSVDLACIMLHAAVQSRWSGLNQTLQHPGDYQLTFSRYIPCPCQQCLPAAVSLFHICGWQPVTDIMTWQHAGLTHIMMCLTMFADLQVRSQAAICLDQEGDQESPRHSSRKDA